MFHFRPAAGREGVREREREGGRETPEASGVQDSQPRCVSVVAAQRCIHVLSVLLCVVQRTQTESGSLPLSPLTQRDTFCLSAGWQGGKETQGAMKEGSVPAPGCVCVCARVCVLMCLCVFLSACAWQQFPSNEWMSDEQQKLYRVLLHTTKACPTQHNRGWQVVSPKPQNPSAQPTLF